MSKRILIATLLLTLALGGLAAAQDQQAQAADQAKKAYDQAKSAIYQKEWVKAVQALQMLETSYPKSGYMGEAYYWLGYSLDKMSANMADRAAQMETRKEAIDKLNKLLALSLIHI